MVHVNKIEGLGRKSLQINQEKKGNIITMCEVFEIENIKEMTQEYVVVTRAGVLNGAFNAYGSVGIAYEGVEGLEKVTFKTAIAAANYINSIAEG